MRLIRKVLPGWRAVGPRQQPSRLVRLGRTAHAIRGAKTSGYTDRGHDFYVYGE
jgi:hypothetical protein